MTHWRGASGKWVFTRPMLKVTDMGADETRIYSVFPKLYLTFTWIPPGPKLPKIPANGECCAVAGD